MTSQVFFRMQHGKAMEPISFSGPSIKLIDLKRAVLEKKDLKTGLDFDLRVVDAENASIKFEGDDTAVPRNTAVVVKRVPVAVGTGIIARLHARRPTASAATHQIILPSKAEKDIEEQEQPEVVAPNEVPPETVPVANDIGEADLEPTVDEEELALLRGVTERYLLSYIS